MQFIVYCFYKYFLPSFVSLSNVYTHDNISDDIIRVSMNACIFILNCAHVNLLEYNTLNLVLTRSGYCLNNSLNTTFMMHV